MNLSQIATSTRSDNSRTSSSWTWAVAALLYAVALVLTTLAFHHDDLLFFVHIGSRFGAGDPEGSLGYDGQFAYFIAADPGTAAPHLDAPAYRFQRLLYPALARLLALGLPSLVPLTLVLVNLAAMALGTAALARLFRRERAPAWCAVLFFLWVGIEISLIYDLNEITALAFALWALVFFARSRYLWAGLFFGLGALAKDSAFIFAAPAALSLLWNRRWQASLEVGLLALGPYLALMAAIYLVTGQFSGSLDPDHPALRPLPFSGLSGADTAAPFIVLFLLLPGLLLALLAFRRLGDVYSLAVWASFVVLVFMPDYSYHLVTFLRLYTPLVLASALMLARLGRRRWLTAAVVAWSATAAFTWLFVMWA